MPQKLPFLSCNLYSHFRPVPVVLATYTNVQFGDLQEVRLKLGKLRFYHRTTPAKSCSQ